MRVQKGAPGAPGSSRRRAAAGAHDQGTDRAPDLTRRSGARDAGPDGSVPGRADCWAGRQSRPRGQDRPDMISRIRSAVSVGGLATLTPAASRASFFAWAVPEEPETMAPAWPMVLPSGAVKPAT